MTYLSVGLVLMMSALPATQVPAAQAPVAQAPAMAQLPSFAGVWAPTEPARTDVLFNNGLSWIPGSGRLVIEQSPNRLTVTKQIPDEILDKILSIWKKEYLTITYRIFPSQGRSGGTGAGGDQSGSWQDDRLVFWETTVDRPHSLSFSLDGDRLKMETHTVLGPGKENRTTVLYSRVR